MSEDEFLMLLEAQVDMYNAGGSADYMAGNITDLIAEYRKAKKNES